MPWRRIVQQFREFLSSRLPATDAPLHLQRGQIGEAAARERFEAMGYRFLAANFRTRRGELDLVFELPGRLIVFVEVKTRQSDGRVRPAAAVNQAKRLKLSRAALDYLREARRPRIPFRFDIAEVLLDGDRVREVRHIPDAFRLSKPYRYG